MANMQGNPKLVAGRIKLADIFDLRHRVLRAGMPVESARFDGDDNPQTWHVGVFLGAECVCCASFMFVPFEQRVAWQLRGMAAFPKGQGLGKLLLDWSMKEIVEKEYVRLFWCDARESAVGFYKKQDWKVVSEKFEIEGVGPHYKMKRIWEAA